MAEETSVEKYFGGLQKTFCAESQELSGKTIFGVYLPPKAIAGEKCPVVYYLSGLTCTEANFIQKSGFQKYASELGLIVVNPDTSPRGAGVDGEDESYDLGSGAGFYLDATEEKWKKHYRMYSYVTKELPEIVAATIPQADISRAGVFGHSMGGHGALTIYLKNPDKYRSCSAFAPICNPINCPWGQKALPSYLGLDKSTWGQYDACELIKTMSDEKQKLLNPILIDQGSADNFLTGGQLLPENLVSAAKEKGVKVDYRLQEGYGHAYSFVSTFTGDHLKHHADLLR
ncbi:S-formylglutathione hydrolase-like [Symsagittifera roscoffensis]|uniref:S-formylglutathione hydrolase-like n=1 Tax=Symsagittifera roscoffensis TaxID=84072 RepID=UPI00307B1892